MGCGRERKGRTDAGAGGCPQPEGLKGEGCWPGMSRGQHNLSGDWKGACFKFAAIQKATELTETKAGSSDCCCKDTVEGLSQPCISALL